MPWEVVGAAGRGLPSVLCQDCTLAVPLAPGHPGWWWSQLAGGLPLTFPGAVVLLQAPITISSTLSSSQDALSGNAQPAPPGKGS